METTALYNYIKLISSGKITEKDILELSEEDMKKCLHLNKQIIKVLLKIERAEKLKEINKLNK